jgi:spore coat protein U-like protein
LNCKKIIQLPGFIYGSILSSNNLFFKKRAKFVLAKSTGALTCLLGLLIISRASAQTTTVTGSMSVSTVISADSPAANPNGSTGSYCSISAGNMNFAAYTGSLITATSVVSVECSNGKAYTISFNDTPDANPDYYLVRVGGNSATASDRLNVTFTNTAGATMTNGAATISGTGTGIGSSATAGTITGTIAASQTGKIAGTYSKTMTLNIVY